ncbi:MAG: hypothetical protein ACI4B9_03725 [Eggerthellaceae bacterium]
MSCFLLGNLVVFSSYAARLSSVELEQSFGVDAVKVEVDCLRPENKLLLPGSSVPLHFFIRETGADCYIRCKAEYRMEDPSGAEGRVVSVDYAGMLDDGLWAVAQDGYAYYKPVLHRGSSVVLEEAVRDAFEGDAESFSHIFTVEAVQARHMDPDYGAASPWGDIRIQEYKGQAVVFRQGNGDTPYSLSYSQDGGFTVSDGGLFGEFATMVPGDERSGKVEVRNTGSKPAQMLFWVSAPEGQATETLRDSARLKVSVSSEQGAKTLFEGNLQQACASEKLRLGELGAGESRDMEFTLFLPASLGNEAAAQSGTMAFRFQAQPVEAGEPSGGDDSGGSPDGPGDQGASGGNGQLEGDGADDSGSQVSADGSDASGAATTEGVRQLASTAKRSLAKTRDFLAPVVPALIAVAGVSTLAAFLSWFAGQAMRRKRLMMRR